MCERKCRRTSKAGIQIKSKSKAGIQNPNCELVTHYHMGELRFYERRHIKDQKTQSYSNTNKDPLAFHLQSDGGEGYIQKTAAIGVSSLVYENKTTTTKKQAI